MDTSRPPTQRAHEMPFVYQFSVFLPNRVGQLHELLEMLAEGDMDVAGLSIVDSTEWAVVRMVFTDPGKAREMLKRRAAAFTECEILAVVLEDAQTFRRVCKALVGAELNIAFAYPLLVRPEGKPALALHVDDPVLARQVLAKHGFTLLDHEDM